MRQPAGTSKRVHAVDGMHYGEAIDRELDSVMDGTFSGGSGPKALAYLESLTTRRVLGPDASDQHLRHLEGARWIVGIIRQRMSTHRERTVAAATKEKAE